MIGRTFGRGESERAWGRGARRETGAIELGRATLRRAAAVLLALGCIGASAHAQTGPQPLGAMANPGQPSEINPIEYYPTGCLLEIVIPNMPTGFQEKCIVYTPDDSLHLGPRPTLVVFHPFGQNHLDAYDATDLVEECRARGWFLIAPLGASKKGFSSLTSQANQEFVIEGVMDAFKGFVDRTRVYGIGFSMGAGDAATYAARHLDPWDPIFAAVFLHSGTMDKGYAWLTNPGTQWIHEFWFGGTPQQVPFEYSRVSPAQVDWVSGMLRPGLHLGTNLQHIANKTYIAQDDPSDTLKEQAFALVQYMASFVGDFAFEFDTTDYSALPFATHLGRARPGRALDWLSQRQLSIPTEGTLRVDVDGGQHWWFRVGQDQLGAFTDFDWKLDAAANRIEVTASQNLGTVRVPLPLLGFGPGQITVKTRSADNTADTFVLGNLGSAPTQVLRNGLATAPGVDYQYDALTGDLRLFGGAFLDVWRVTP